MNDPRATDDASLGGLFAAADEARVFTDPEGYAVSWSTINARAETKLLGMLADGQQHPTSDIVDAIAYVFESHGALVRDVRPLDQPVEDVTVTGGVL